MKRPWWPLVFALLICAGMCWAISLVHAEAVAFGLLLAVFVLMLCGMLAVGALWLAWKAYRCLAHAIINRGGLH